MPQSLLALLAILLASLLSIQQVRSGHRTGSSLEHLTIQAAAADVAAERLAFLGSLPFDEGVKAAPATSLAGLTPVVGGAFTRVTGPDPPGDDLDDFHQTQTTALAVLKEGLAAQPLRAAVTVAYVSEADGEAPSPTPTRLKRATVVVTTPGADPVRISQLFSCGGHCTW